MDHDSREDQLQAQYRRLGTLTPRCSRPPCSEADPFALSLVEGEVVCYECQAAGAGRSIIEQQHVAGRKNRPETIGLLGNDHRVADSYKPAWPQQTLRNPDGSPLLRAAACLRGWLDVLRLIMERTVGWVPEFLEWLDAQLIRHHGQAWWSEFGWAGQR